LLGKARKYDKGSAAIQPVWYSVELFWGIAFFVALYPCYLITSQPILWQKTDSQFASISLIINLSGCIPSNHQKT